jgi:hypothetical protein
LGNAGDPVLATYGTKVYLAGNPHRPSSYLPQGSSQYKLFMPLWTSTDYGQTFASPVNIAAVSQGTPPLTPVTVGANGGDILDKPWLVANPSNGDVYLAVRWLKSPGLAQGEVTLLFFRSTNGGTTWEHREFRYQGIWVGQPDLAVAGSDLYLFLEIANALFRVYKSTDRGASFHSPPTDDNPDIEYSEIPNTIIEHNGNLRRNSHDSFSADEFTAPWLIHAAINPQSGHVYLVYHDKPSSTATDTDIFLHYTTDGGVNWTGPLLVNDVQTGDQWQPTLAVKPDGSKLFIGWYDRKHDPQFNHRIRVRGMISTINTQTPLAAPTYFDISAEDFAPVFTGSKTAEGSFDPAYGPLKWWTWTNSQGQVMYSQERCGIRRGQIGDYDQVNADSTFIYYSWGDSRIRRSGRLQTDVRFKKISW